MTKKDYAAIAAVFKDWAREGNSPDAQLMHVCLARGLARVFLAENERFNQKKFLVACGVKERFFQTCERED